MKTTRLKSRVELYLRDEPRTTLEIRDYINDTLRHGTTTQQLGNVLSKHPDFTKVDHVIRAGNTYGGYNVCQWWLTDILSEIEA